jgi:hypothetical protein
MGLFLKMILNTIEKQLEIDGRIFADEVCGELGVPFEELRPMHMERFSEIAYQKAEPRFGEAKAKSMAGIISHFKNSRVG